MDTPDATEAQEPVGDRAQPDIGRIITGSIVLDEVAQLRVYRTARETVDRLPGVSWADKALLGALVGRMDFAKGVVTDAHDWLAQWFNSSLGTIRKRREALAKAGHIHDRERMNDVRGGNFTNEIAIPIVAKAVADIGRMSENGRPKTGTIVGTLSSDRLGGKKEVVGNARERATSEIEYSTGEEAVTRGELVPVGEVGGPLAVFFDGHGVLDAEVRDALEGDGAARAELHRHRARGVSELDLVGIANRAWVSARGKTSPVRYWLQVVDADVGKLLAKGSHSPVAETSRLAPNRRRSEIVLRVGRDEWTTYVTTADRDRLMQECLGLSEGDAYLALQETAEPYQNLKRSISGRAPRVPSAKMIVDETVARLQSKPFAVEPEKTMAEQIADDLRRIVGSGEG